jgi:hypothetical protein
LTVVKLPTEIRRGENALANFRVNASSFRFSRFRRECLNCKDPEKRLPAKGKTMAIPTNVLTGNIAKRAK